MGQYNTAFSAKQAPANTYFPMEKALGIVHNDGSHNFLSAPLDNVTLLCYYHNNVTEHCYVSKSDGRNDMDQELISKKELLETFGISYGALYR